MTTRPEKTPDERLAEAYQALESTSLEPEVKIAVKAILTIRQAINWAAVSEEERKGKVDAAIVKYIRASSAQNLPSLVNDVLNRLPYEKIYRRALGDFAMDVYPRVTTDEGEAKLWERAFQRVKRETIPLLMLSKKFYQATEEVTP